MADLLDAEESINNLNDLIELDFSAIAAY